MRPLVRAPRAPSARDARYRRRSRPRRASAPRALRSRPSKRGTPANSWSRSCRAAALRVHKPTSSKPSIALIGARVAHPHRAQAHHKHASPLRLVRMTGFAHRRLLLHDRPMVSAPVVRGQSGGGRRPRPRALRFPPSRADSVSADQRQQMLGDRLDLCYVYVMFDPFP